MKDIKLMTSESVTIGHPDKICDQISDAILDTILAQDPDARVACEVCCNTGMVLVMGEISTDCYVDISKVVRETIKEIGYTNSEFGFDSESCAVLVSINEQSKDIDRGVSEAIDNSDDIADKIGAGDQGMVFGYATDETEEYLPLPVVLVHKLTKALADKRKSNQIPYLRPDGKALVTVKYVDGVPQTVDSVVMAAQHAPTVEQSTIHNDLVKMAQEVIPAKYLTEQTKYYINQTGRFVIGGPVGDSGLTGRKIIVDTYGGFCPHGGGAFSGKDPTKVDRSGAYMARYIAKNLVAAGVCHKCTFEISYAIGKARPVGMYVDTYGTSKFSNDQIIDCVNTVFDVRPYSIIKNLDLQKPVYSQTSKNGHFGNPNFSWEKLDKVDQIKKFFNI